MACLTSSPGQSESGARRDLPRVTRVWQRSESVVNCDQLLLVPKSALTHYVGSLSAPRLGELKDALCVALDLD